MGFRRPRPNLKAGLMPAALGISELIGVAGGDLAGDAGAFFQITADDDSGRRRAGAVALLEAAIAAVEARHHLVMAFAGRRFGLDQALRLGAPLLAFVAAADAAQEMQGAENFGQPLEVVVVGRRHHRGRRRWLRLLRSLELGLRWLQRSWRRRLGGRRWRRPELEKLRAS